MPTRTCQLVPRRALRLVCCALLLSCSTSGRPGGGDGGVMPDAGEGDTPDRRRTGNGGRFGAACASSRDCGVGLVCDEEVDVSIAVEGLPHDQTELPSSLFPDGVCTPVAAAAFDPSGQLSCDPREPRAQQGCGGDGVCVALSLSGETQAACRLACEPAASESGCERHGYTCDFDLRACVEGCLSDEECRLRLEDADGDGEADALAYDEDSLAVCDPETFRCSHPHSGEGDTGVPCERVDDCDPDGLCIQELQTLGGLPFPGGFCSKFGCEIDGRECRGEGATCERLRSWSGAVTAHACLTRCEVGAESEDERLGPEGHGQGCRPGYRCHYNGGAGNEGVCVGGEYNAVMDNNIGAACERDEQCYSPFGLGRCLTLQAGEVTAPTGTCSLYDCAAPGIPEDVCGDAAQCLGLNGDLTFCVQRCQEAEQCAEGFACADDDGDPATDKLCWPVCFADEDCRKQGEACALDSDLGAGTCVALDD